MEWVGEDKIVVGWLMSVGSIFSKAFYIDEQESEQVHEPTLPWLKYKSSSKYYAWDIVTAS